MNDRFAYSLFSQWVGQSYTHIMIEGQGIAISSSILVARVVINC